MLKAQHISKPNISGLPSQYKMAAFVWHLTELSTLCTAMERQKQWSSVIYQIVDESG